MRSVSLLSRRGGLFIAGAAMIAGSIAACSGSDDGSAVTGCPDDLAYFEANLWEPILSKKCAVCHSSDGLARGSQLVLRPSSEPGALEANFEAIKAIAASVVEGESTLLLRPSGRHPSGHTGGAIIPFQGPEFKTLETFVSRVTQGKNCDAPIATCNEVKPGARMLRRLSRHEYDATIKDLFGFESKWGASFTADTVVNGFDNNAAVDSDPGRRLDHRYLEREGGRDDGDDHGDRAGLERVARAAGVGELRLLRGALSPRHY